ncbi:hypothetical protein BH18ACT5_BH18ACT5_18900 [soil metagenome]
MSGWRAGLVAVALGAVVLGVGWFLNRPDAGDPSTTTDPVIASDLRLACSPAFTVVCEELATRNGLAPPIGYSINDPVPADAVVIGFAGDLAPEATAFARSPIAIGVWAEKSGTLENACGEVDAACLVEQAGTPWVDIGGSSDWGAVRLGLADPETGIADQEAWKRIAAQNPASGFGQFVPLKQTTDGNVWSEMVLFPSRADIVVSSEVAIGSQLENARVRAGRVRVYYPDPTPFLPVAAIGEGRAAASFIESLTTPENQALLGSLGLRPLTGAPVNLMQDLGTPGAEAAGVTEAEKTTLIASWNSLIGS